MVLYILNLKFYRGDRNIKDSEQNGVSNFYNKYNFTYKNTNAAL
jgi:hypothetical protein